ncbi:MAG TPA: hypothetical protein VLO00_11010, partial [Cryobacterium sp.]|nr:hypothetical protein [Cryobacterium sp.]
CFHLPRNERMVAVANRIIRQVAAEHRLAVVPLHATTKRLGLRSVATHVAGDLFHPNNSGYRAWAEAFLPALSAHLERGIRPAALPSPAPEPAPTPTVATPESGGVSGPS